MPKISEFFGISILMYYTEHPPPHFHARYGGAEALVSIDDLSILEGKLPPRVMGLVVEWGTLHLDELRAAWESARGHQPPGKIAPLE